MPQYTMKCLSCRTSQAVFRPMSESDKPVRCECGELMVRDFKTDFALMRSGENPGWPLVSTAAGVHPDEVPAMKDIDRKAGVNTQYTPDGDPIFRSPGHRKKYLKAHKMFDRDGYY